MTIFLFFILFILIAVPLYVFRSRAHVRHVKKIINETVEDSTIKKYSDI